MFRTLLVSLCVLVVLLPGANTMEQEHNSPYSFVKIIKMKDIGYRNDFSTTFVKQISPDRLIVFCRKMYGRLVDLKDPRQQQLLHPGNPSPYSLTNIFFDDTKGHLLAFSHSYDYLLSYACRSSEALKDETMYCESVHIPYKFSLCESNKECFIQKTETETTHRFHLVYPNPWKMQLNIEDTALNEKDLEVATTCSTHEELVDWDTMYKKSIKQPISDKQLRETKRSLLSGIKCYHKTRNQNGKQIMYCGHEAGIITVWEEKE